MKELQKILLEHYERYPHMQIEDFVKLIYQITFGPKHFTASPTKADIETYLDLELESFKLDPHSPLIEDLGEGYCRIYLGMIVLNKMTKNELVDLFYASIQACDSMTNDSIKLFKNRINLLLSLITTKTIALPIVSSHEYVDQYYQNGFLPAHHSPIYNRAYHPHYRLVNQKLLMTIPKFLPWFSEGGVLNDF